MHPWCTLSVACVWAAGAGQPSKVRPAASAGGGSRAVQGRSRLGDRRLRVEPRRVLELVHHVAVGAEREPGVVAELAGDVDDGAPLAEQQRGERMPEVLLVPTSAQVIVCRAGGYAEPAYRSRVGPAYRGL
jgi:hypothetical protein